MVAEVVVTDVPSLLSVLNGGRQQRGQKNYPDLPVRYSNAVTMEPKRCTKCQQLKGAGHFYIRHEVRVRREHIAALRLRRSVCDACFDARVRELFRTRQSYRAAGAKCQRRTRRLYAPLARRHFLLPLLLQAIGEVYEIDPQRIFEKTRIRGQARTNGLPDDWEWVTEARGVFIHHLCSLMGVAMPVCEVAALLNLNHATVNHHVNRLRENRGTALENWGKREVFAIYKRLRRETYGTKRLNDLFPLLPKTALGQQP